jgi:hypothetical protein
MSTLRIIPPRRRAPAVIEGDRDQLRILDLLLHEALKDGASTDDDGQLVIRVLGES